MRVENTRSGPPTQFQHRAARYACEDELLSITVPLVEDCVNRGEPVAILVGPDTEHRLRNELRSTAGLIHFPTPDAWLRGSGQAVVTRRARELRELIQWAGSATVIAEYDPMREQADGALWTETDAAMNIAMGALPATMVCLYPATLRSAGLDSAVRWNHQQLLDPDGQVRENPDYRIPAQVLTVNPVPAPPALGSPTAELSFTPWQLVNVRSMVDEATARAGLASDRAEDFVLAVNEVASNAVEHGNGIALLQLWAQSDRLTCDVHSRGALAEPFPGLRPPHSGSPRGRGIWIARQLCDLLHVWSDGSGTHVRLQAAQT